MARGWSAGQSLVGGVHQKLLTGRRSNLMVEGSERSVAASSLCGHALQPVFEEKQAVPGHLAFFL